MITSRIKYLLMLSRPRIWIYTTGSFLVGIFLSGLSMEDILIHHNIWKIVYICIWLTIPANIFLYAINDTYDTETDANNPKKNGFELRSDQGDKTKLITLSIVSLLLYIPLLRTADSTTFALFLIWIVIVLTYNIPPLRLKARPFLDNIFALNFPLWGVYGYYFIHSKFPSLPNILALAVFAIIMHIYTATGDIEYDKKDRIKTTAVFFKTAKTNLLICTTLTCGLFLYFILIPNIALTIVTLQYIIFFLYCYTRHESLNLISYKYFIYLHYIAGFTMTNLYYLTP